ncbi:S8 family serine peptidase [Streptomyces sp. CB03238]|uniref:S8 family serine peptidase n=1 Tax=Streptomyces sp. CB03238 TaxID=1907777 RepID=UPI001180AC53|nr:S8 family serine peptidase [Streptomyces sp. CB03238]
MTPRSAPRRARAPRRSGAALLAAATAALLLPAAPATAAPHRVDTSCRTRPEKGEPLPPDVPKEPLAERLGLASAWDLTEGQGVMVGVIDSGVDRTHPELRAAVDAGSEFVMVRSKKEFERQEPEPDADCEGHGTAVAGIIAASRGGETRIAGVAPRARIHPVRMVDGVDRSSPRALAAAIDDAVDAGSTVLNLSLALPVDRAEVRRAIARAVARDVVVVAAAGNEGLRGTKVYPAAYDGVIAVAAVGDDGTVMEESNSGDWVDLAAYGDGLVFPAAGGSGYRTDQGTSYAAPQVAGAAALLRSRFPDLSAAQIGERLTASADPLGGADDTRAGAGLVDPFAALTRLGPATSDAVRPKEGSGRVPLQALPREEPWLSRQAATAVLWSAGLLCAIAAALFGAPAIRRAAARGWRPGHPGVRTHRVNRHPDRAAAPHADTLARLTRRAEPGHHPTTPATARQPSALTTHRTG